LCTQLSVSACDPARPGNTPYHTFIGMSAQNPMRAGGPLTREVYGKYNV
jgi:hypothetical protein